MSLEAAASARPAIYTETSEGVAVTRVPRGSSADAAGILPGDRILEINGKADTRELMDQAFGQFRVAEPVTVVVRRPGRRIQILVQP